MEIRLLFISSKAWIFAALGGSNNPIWISFVATEFIVEKLAHPTLILLCGKSVPGKFLFMNWFDAAVSRFHVVMFFGALL